MNGVLSSLAILPTKQEFQENPLGWLVGIWIFLNALTATLLPRATAIVLTVLGVIIIVCALLRKTLPNLPGKPALAGLLIILALAGLSILWSIAPDESARRLPRLALLFLWGLLALGATQLVTAKIATRAMTATTAAFLIALITLGIEIHNDHIIYREIKLLLMQPLKNDHVSGNILNQPAALIALYLWPVSLGLWLKQYRLLSIVLIAFSLAVFIPSNAQSVSLALIAGAGGSLAAALHPRSMKIWFSALIILIMTAMPHLPQLLQQLFNNRPHMLVTSAQHRLEIWQYVVGKIFEHPILGHGLEASRVLGAGTQSTVLPASSLLPLHPHNGFLQIWLELGLAAYVTLGLLCLWVVHKISQLQGAAMVFSTGLFICGLSLFSTAFGMWQSWLIAIEFSSVGALLLALRLSDNVEKNRQLTE